MQAAQSGSTALLVFSHRLDPSLSKGKVVSQEGSEGTPTKNTALLHFALGDLCSVPCASSSASFECFHLIRVPGPDFR